MTLTAIVDSIDVEPYYQDTCGVLYCADCLALLKQLPSESIDLVVIDPPYGMDYVSGRRKQKFNRIINDDNVAWMEALIPLLYRKLKENTHSYLFCNDYSLGDLRTAFKASKFQVKRTLIWEKNNHTAGDLEGDYANKTEFILYAQKGRRLLNGKRCTNILKFDRAVVQLHPTQKPIPLLSFLINNSSNSNELILDPFCGSGTALVAAKRSGRCYIGIDIVPEHCKTARRFLAATPEFLL